MSSVDVVVVGAGLSGLVCARRLAEAGLSVQVIEARDRVGGRMEHGALPDGQPIELGGQWIGPGQTRMYALLDELGLTTFPKPTTRVSTSSSSAVTGAASPVTRHRSGGFALADLAVSLPRLHRQAGCIDPAAPWTARHAQHLDARTFETWIAAVVASLRSS